MNPTNQPIELLKHALHACTIYLERKKRLGLLMGECDNTWEALNR